MNWVHILVETVLDVFNLAKLLMLICRAINIHILGLR